MKKLTDPQIVLRPAINQALYQEITALEERCCSYEPLTFKRELEYKLQHPTNEPIEQQKINEFLYYNEQELIGYLGICDFGGEELEISGMVHPAFRRQGIFTQLYQLVEAEFKRRAPSELLLVCHKNSDSGKKFVEHLNATYHHAEYDMQLDPANFSHELSYRLTFQETEGHLFIGKQEEQVIGQVRLEQEEVGGIYALEVVPEFRGQGYGRELLTWAVEKLLAQGAKKIFLQVDTVNANALGLYQSCGFVEQDVMMYYSIREGEGRT